MRIMHFFWALRAQKKNEKKNGYGRLFHAFFLGAARPKKMKKKRVWARRKAVHDSQKPSTIAKSRPKAEVIF